MSGIESSKELCVI